MTALFLVSTCARSSDVRTLGRDLCRSPSIASTDVGLTILWNQPSAAAAYARAMETATADFLIFAHCDDYFPENWFERLDGRLTVLGASMPIWP
jgi:hypothetical protein